jgi:hypothetical protein
MTDTPIEARCDHCKKLRPLFRYEPDHNAHLFPVLCRWCDRDEQPLLCVRCWDAERSLEENTPATPEEQEAGKFLGHLLQANQRYAEQTTADREACEGIARATAEAEGGVR